jgi:hypothetical protein
MWPKVSLRCLIGPLCLLFPLACPCLAKAADYEQRRDSAALLIQGGKIADGRIEVRLSDTLTLSLRVEGPPTLQVEPIRALSPSEGWQVRPRAGPATMPCGAGRICWQQSFLLRPVRPGDLTLVVAPLRYREGSGTDQPRQALWQPVPCRVATEIQDVTLDELHDVTPPEELPAVPARKLSAVWIGLLGLLAAILAIGGVFLRRPKHRQVAVSPGRWAIQELERLQVPESSADGAVVQFHTRLSAVVRIYLARRFQVRAEEQTTAEVHEALRASGKLTPEQVAAVHTLLIECDLAKFARVAVSTEACRSRVLEARRVVERTTAEPV